MLLNLYLFILCLKVTFHLQTEFRCFWFTAFRTVLSHILEEGKFFSVKINGISFVVFARKSFDLLLSHLRPVKKKKASLKYFMALRPFIYPAFAKKVCLLVKAGSIKGLENMEEPVLDFVSQMQKIFTFHALPCTEGYTILWAVGKKRHLQNKKIILPPCCFMDVNFISSVCGHAKEGKYQGASNFQNLHRSGDSGDRGGLFRCGPPPNQIFDFLHDMRSLFCKKRVERAHLMPPPFIPKTKFLPISSRHTCLFPDMGGGGRRGFEKCKSDQPTPPFPPYDRIFQILTEADALQLRRTRTLLLPILQPLILVGFQRAGWGAFFRG